MRTYIHRLLLAAFFLFGTMLGSFAADSRPAPTPKQIAQWVEQLGDNDFTVREKASKQLWHAGAAAESALVKAVQSDDPEVVRRARELLDKFQWGIYPDTPEDIVALIRAYQSSSGKPRSEVLQKLLDSGAAGLRAVVKIAAAVRNEDQRRLLGDLIARKVPAAFFVAATQNKFEHFERLLEIGHEGKFIAPNQYAAYWLLGGKLPERIALVAARFRDRPEDKWLARTLVFLHRANGDLAQARKAAEKCDRPELLEEILYEMGDWKALAARPDIALADNPAEKWAFRAAFARLAGNQKDFDKAVGELRKITERGGQRELLAFTAAKALLLNDRPADGLALLRTVPDRRKDLFDLFCARQEFAAALELAGEDVRHDKLSVIPDLQLARARLLCLLGDKEGEDLFDRFAERIKDEVDPLWVEKLLTEEMRAGLKDKALVHTAKALSVALPKTLNWETREHLYFAKLFPKQAKTAEVWWTLLRRQFPEETRTTVLRRVQALLQGKVAAKDVKAWIEANPGSREPVPSNNPLRQKDAWVQALAEGAHLAGLDDFAADLLKKADSRDAFIRLGDLLAAKKQWAKAAESYQQAWKKAFVPEKQRDGKMGFDPLPLFLAGDALVRAGQEKEGKKLIEQAHWLPFAAEATRFNFIRALNQRQHKEEARRELDLLIRLGEPSNLYSKEGLRLRAHLYRERKDYIRAAEGFEQSMLNCMHSHFYYLASEEYSRAPARVHQLHARRMLETGKLDEALKHLELAWIDWPGNIDLPIAFVPALERLSHKKEAEDLFNRYYGAIEKVCRAYPRFAQAHNLAAWLAACCRRNLDAALEHGQKAVELAPANAGYHDTLAEVYFQRGDKDKAIALQKRAIELNPKRMYFRKQLKRMETGDPSADRPPDDT